MVKLSAHGSELARLSKEIHTPQGELTVWERSTYSVRSDGHILRKDDVRLRPDRYDPQGRLHSHGWKLYRKLKGTPAQRRLRVRELLPELLERWEQAGFTIERKAVTV